jgi:hypothetical protein
MSEMQGSILGSRALRLSQATPKKSSSGGMGMGMGAPMGGGGGGGSPAPEQSDPSNTTIFVGNLDSMVGEDELRGYRRISPRVLFLCPRIGLRAHQLFVCHQSLHAVWRAGLRASAAGQELRIRSVRYRLTP